MCVQKHNIITLWNICVCVCIHIYIKAYTLIIPIYVFYIDILTTCYDKLRVMINVQFVNII